MTEVDKLLLHGGLKNAVKHAEHMKAAVRAKLEHRFRVVRRQCAYQKMRAAESVDGAARVAGFGREGVAVRWKMGLIKGRSVTRQQKQARQIVNFRCHVEVFARPSGWPFYIQWNQRVPKFIAGNPG